MLFPHIASLLALPLAAPSLSPQGQTHFVGPGQIASIQAAVDTASEGDRIEIAAGNYAGFHVTGKAVSIVAAPGSRGSVIVEGPCSVQNLQSNSVLLVAGITTQSTFTVQSNQGPLRIVDCILEGRLSFVHINRACFFHLSIFHQ